MGPVLVIVNFVLTSLLLLLSGFAPWALVVAGVPWAFALGYSARYGHRNFGTTANTDLFIVFAGFGITAAIFVPKFAERRPCERARRAAEQVVSAQREWKKTHPTYATGLSELNLKLDGTVSVSLKNEENDFLVSATHPECVDERGALLPAVSNSGF